MKKQKKFARILDSLYKNETTLRDKIEKNIIDLLKSNDLSHFRFNTPISVANNEDASCDGKVFGVYLDVLSTDETQDCLVIEASWRVSSFKFEKDYNTTEFYLEDLVEIYNQIYSDIS